MGESAVLPIQAYFWEELRKKRKIYKHDMFSSSKLCSQCDSMNAQKMLRFLSLFMGLNLVLKTHVQHNLHMHILQYNIRQIGNSLPNLILGQLDCNFGNSRALKVLLHNATIQVFRSRRVEPNSRFTRATPKAIPDQPRSVLNSFTVFYLKM